MTPGPADQGEQGDPSVEPVLVEHLEPTADQMRHALGHFATGVTIVTGFDRDGTPVGFACQSFASVSLHPPLVLFCADHRGRSWPRMRGQGRFTVNVLGHHQRDLIGRFGSRAGARFDGLDWAPSALGGPSLPGVLMRVHCTVEQVHVAGDHDVVVGRVRDLEDGESGRPMLFYRGRFTVTERRTSAGAGEGGVDEAGDEGPGPMDDYWG